MKIILGVNLYDYDEVSKMIGVGKATLGKYVRERGIKPQRVERKYYLSEEEIKKIVLPERG